MDVWSTIDTCLVDLPCSSRCVQVVGSTSRCQGPSGFIFGTGLIYYFQGQKRPRAALDPVELSGTAQQNTHLHPDVASYFNIGDTHPADSDRLLS